MTGSNRQKVITKASWVGIFGNSFLSLIKLVVGGITGSLSLIGDGIDSFTDILISIVSLYAAKISEKPPDSKHPWGHGRAETLATKFIAFIIGVIGLQIIISAANSIRGYEERVIATELALVAAGISIVGKGFLSFYKFRQGRRVNSPLLIADAINMRNDIILSLTVFLGLFSVQLFKMPIFDLFFAIVAGGWILRSSFLILVETSSEMMDSVANLDVYKTVFNTAKSIEGVINPHKIRVRKININYSVDIDIEVDPTITVLESHEISLTLERRIKEELGSVFDVMVHIEPAGEMHCEQYGLSEKEIFEES